MELVTGLQTSFQLHGLLLLFFQVRHPRRVEYKLKYNIRKI
jgi:hypothetical protein